MTWHAALLTAEQAAIWSAVAGAVATVFALLHRRPLKRLLTLLDTSSAGGLGDVVEAIKDSEPIPDLPRTKHGRT